MSSSSSPPSLSGITTQNKLLMETLGVFYENPDNMKKLLGVVNGETKISLRIIDWFVTNYSKKNYVIYNGRFKVYNDYKLKLKAYSKKRFDPFCRWERIYIPSSSISPDFQMETTIGQLNFFKWAIENKILDYIDTNYLHIEEDMNARNSSSKRKTSKDTSSSSSSSRANADSRGDAAAASDAHAAAADAAAAAAAAAASNILAATQCDTHQHPLPPATQQPAAAAALAQNPDEHQRPTRRCGSPERAPVAHAPHANTIHAPPQSSVLDSRGGGGGGGSKTRKKREELSVSACRFLKKETVKVMLTF